MCGGAGEGAEEGVVLVGAVGGGESSGSSGRGGLGGVGVAVADWVLHDVTVGALPVPTCRVGAVT